MPCVYLEGGVGGVDLLPNGGLWDVGSFLRQLLFLLVKFERTTHPLKQQQCLKAKLAMGHGSALSPPPPSSFRCIITRFGAILVTVSVSKDAHWMAVADAVLMENVKSTRLGASFPTLLSPPVKCCIWGENKTLQCLG